jgi:hypothetical protein
MWFASQTCRPCRHTIFGSFGDMLRAALCLLASASAGAVDYWDSRPLRDPVTARDERRCTTDCDLIVAYCTEDIKWVLGAAPRFRTIHIYNKWCVPALWLRLSAAPTMYPLRHCCASLSTPAYT